VIRRVPVAVVRPLRAAVLRPGQPESAAAFPEDDEAVHLAAYADDEPDRVVGCVTIFPEELVGERGPGWRLRGMATDPAVRGTGVGAELLAAADDVARDGGAELLWCNARVSALGFYERSGWTVVSEEFVTETGIPHRRMVRRL
jgi:GNAT superfamily N-acetyltransferase